ncbi:hypothetical protein DPX16_10279 [Anabarilius grahami]|uniref:Uncharacterized protein n=1 Tax=Anabarilius grahami TaxID=495550 RepID=A0A3N0YCM9_ANAGA|nr:hypothetical protein DPX16_10279 [Anabarilius grahami]
MTQEQSGDDPYILQHGAPCHKARVITRIRAGSVILEFHRSVLGCVMGVEIRLSRKAAAKLMSRAGEEHLLLLSVMQNERQ